MDIPLNIRNMIISKYKLGMKQKVIATDLHVSPSMVCRLKKQFNATGEVTPRRKERCGRKPKLSERELRKIHRQSLGNPGLTAREVQGAVGGSVVQASLRTVQRSIRKVGLIPYRPSFGPSLQRKQRLVRLKWAKDKAGWTKDDWSTVIFSDETAIEQNSENRSRFVRKAKHHPITVAHLKAHLPFKKRLLVWGCISSEGPGPIKVIRGTMDGDKYPQTLSLIHI